MLEAKRGHPLHIFATTHGAPDLMLTAGCEPRIEDYNALRSKGTELYKEGLHQRLLRIRLKIHVGSAKENY